MQVRNPSSNSVASSTILIMLLSLLGYGIGFLTQVVIAHYFGVSKDLDAFVAAAIIPEFIFGLTNAVLFTSFVVVFPTYLKEMGEEKGKNFITSLFTAVTIILIIIVLLIILTSPFIAKIIGPGFTVEQLSLTSVLIKILAGSILFFGISSLATGVLYHEHKFSTPKLFRTFLAIGIIAGVVLLQQYVGVMSLAIGMFVGSGIGVIAQYVAMRKEGYKLSFAITFKDPYLKKLLNLSWPLIITSMFFYINKTIANMIASTLGVGSLSILNYAFIVMNIVVTLIAGSIAAAIFPIMTKQMAYKETKGLQDLFVKSTMITIFLVVPLMIILMLLNKEIIHLLFERGAFVAKSTKEVGLALFFFSIGLIPISMMNVIVNVYHATQRMKQKMYLFLLLLLVNVVLNLIFSRFLSHNGIALGMAVSYWVASGVGFYYIARKLEGFTYGALCKEMSKITTAAVTMLVVLYLGYQAATGRIEITELSIVGKIMVLLFLVGSGVIPYIIVATFLRSKSVIIVYNKLKEIIVNEK
jgi:putative peptidoglycan lipid II flippase